MQLLSSVCCLWSSLPSSKCTLSSPCSEEVPNSLTDQSLVYRGRSFILLLPPPQVVEQLWFGLIISAFSSVHDEYSNQSVAVIVAPTADNHLPLAVLNVLENLPSEWRVQIFHRHFSLLTCVPSAEHLVTRSIHAAPRSPLLSQEMKH